MCTDHLEDTSGAAHPCTLQQLCSDRTASWTYAKGFTSRPEETAIIRVGSASVLICGEQHQPWQRRREQLPVQLPSPLPSNTAVLHSQAAGSGARCSGEAPHGVCCVLRRQAGSAEYRAAGGCVPSSPGRCAMTGTHRLDCACKSPLDCGLDSHGSHSKLTPRRSLVDTGVTLTWALLNGCTSVVWPRPI